ncbi:hypothetical protein WICPIJ_003930 [Wickerhamomyces pijperi]|uniref:Protein kinase domain-containing protein n=1 Tax=Wickerhamomyces pijperi TaxID=599730 RepID=A0A9P8TN94_WICPI|nr:hypothetical protein WICPIJ_003930 [Wickerhamomyces pijperi]
MKKTTTSSPLSTQTFNASGDSPTHISPTAATKYPEYKRNNSSKTDILKRTGSSGPGAGGIPRLSTIDTKPYSPVRTPSSSSRMPKSRNNSATSQQNKSSISSSHSDQLKQAHSNYSAQEKTYLRKIKNGKADDYYTTAIIADLSESDYISDDDDEDDPQRQDADNLENQDDGLFKGLDLEMDPYETLGAEFLESAKENPTLIERMEWQTMLTLVLKGDVVTSEKIRIKTQNDFNAQTTYKDNLWLGIKAFLLGRTEDQQMKIIMYNRSIADETISEILGFKVKDQENAREEVRELLDKFENVKDLWRDQTEMVNEKPICATELFLTRIDALNSWQNITDAFDTHVKMVKEWVKSDDLDLTTKHTDGFTEASFPERLLKERDIVSIFKKRIFSSGLPWVNKSKEAYLAFHEYYEELGLPNFLSSLSQICAFPLELIEEVIKVRLVYARKVDNPTMMMIDEMIADFSTYISIAVSLKHNYIEYCKGWSMEMELSEAFDDNIVEAIGYLFKLLNKKLINTTTKSFKTFKEPDDLEDTWKLLRNVGVSIKNAGPEIASQICILLSRLAQRLNSYVLYECNSMKDLAFDEKKSNEQRSLEMLQLVSKSTDNFGLIRRKLLKLTMDIRKAFSNAALFQLNQVKEFLELLRDTGHFLIQSPHSSRGTYCIASGNLYGRSDAIIDILNGSEIGSEMNDSRRLFAEGDVRDDSPPDIGYVIVINAPMAMVWEGEIVGLHSENFNFDIKKGQVLVITQGSSGNLRHIKSEFLSVVGDTVTFIEHRSSITRVNKELIKTDRLFYRVVISLLDDVKSAVTSIQHIDKHHEAVHSLFVFVRDVCKNSLRIMETSRRPTIIKRMIAMSIDWVAFIVDDCIPTDKRTFRWCVAALEFAMEVSKGYNIVTLEDEYFSRLKEKVAGCMSLLISHFDIMGARSSEAEKKMLKTQFKPTNLQDDALILQGFSDQTMKQIQSLEARLPCNLVGKVIDDTESENQFLSILASQFASISMRWQKRKFIGGGSFGSVYSAINLDTGAVLAVKEIKLQDPSSFKHIVPSIKEEMTVLEMLNHPNIVQYYGVEVHRDKVNLFMEYCEGGSLAALLEHGRIEDEVVIQLFALQMFEGLAYLHERNIIHRDIKPENILFDHNGVIKFVDFGAAKVIANNVTRKITKVNSMTGTPMYMSPEVITGSVTSKYGAVDIWSTGCCVLEMATGRRPWAALDNEWAIMYHIAAGHLPTFPTKDQLGDSGINFLYRCLQQDPNKRPTAVELLQDPWLVDIRNKAFEDGSSSSSEVSSEYGDGN